MELAEKGLVRLLSGNDAGPPLVGRITRLGPEQSIVRWSNGNENCVVNTWVEPVVEDEKLVPIPKMKAPDERMRSEFTTHGTVTGRLPPVEKPKRTAPDDDIVDRLKAKTPEQLKSFAVANDVWDDKYDALPNPGLRRMNVVNRLRAKIKKGHKVAWS